MQEDFDLESTPLEQRLAIGDLDAAYKGACRTADELDVLLKCYEDFEPLDKNHLYEDWRRLEDWEKLKAQVCYLIIETMQGGWDKHLRAIRDTSWLLAVVSEPPHCTISSSPEERGAGPPLARMVTGPGERYAVGGELSIERAASMGEWLALLLQHLVDALCYDHGFSELCEAIGAVGLQDLPLRSGLVLALCGEFAASDLATCDDDLDLISSDDLDFYENAKGWYAVWRDFQMRLTASDAFNAAAATIDRDRVIGLLATVHKLWNYDRIMADLKREFSRATWKRATEGRAISLTDDTRKKVATRADDKKRPMRKEEANKRAHEFAKGAPGFLKAPIREWSKKIGCSAKLVGQLPLWRAIHPTEKDQPSEPHRSPHTVSFTKKLEATMGKEDAQLHRLLNEHKEDSEPSPLEPDPPDGPPIQVFSPKSL